MKYVHVYACAHTHELNRKHDHRSHGSWSGCNRCHWRSWTRVSATSCHRVRSMCVRVCVCACACVRARVAYVCACVCVCTCLCVCVSARARACAQHDEHILYLFYLFLGKKDAPWPQLLEDLALRHGLEARVSACRCVLRQSDRERERQGQGNRDTGRQRDGGTGGQRDRGAGGCSSYSTYLPYTRGHRNLAHAYTVMGVRASASCARMHVAGPG